MRIIIDIGHPAHVHLFKNFANEMQKKGHKILFTCRQKEFEMELLIASGLNFKNFGKHYLTIWGKLYGLIKFNIQMLFTGIKFKADIFLSHGSIYAAQIGWLLGKPHISFEDTYNFEQIKIYRPFTKAIIVGDYKHPTLGSKEIIIRGYHELCYLHPNVFTPSIEILEKLNIKQNEKYVILRFVSWAATHDIGHKGFSIENKIKAVNEFSKYAKVFISSEKKLPEVLSKYQIKISPEKMHDAIAFASLVFGESATMVSEGAVLGVPGIYIDNTGRFYTKEQEDKYGLVYNFSESFSDQEKSIHKGVELLTKSKATFQQRLERMLIDKIDVTAFLVWFIENYPESFHILKKDPDYQLRFK